MTAPEKSNKYRQLPTASFPDTVAIALPCTRGCVEKNSTFCKSELRTAKKKQECSSKLSVVATSLLEVRGRTGLGLRCDGPLAFIRVLDDTRAFVGYTG